MGFSLSVLKVTNTFALHVNGSCDVHGVRGVRTATVCDVTMMYSKEQYMENVHSHEGGLKCNLGSDPLGKETFFSHSAVQYRGKMV